MNKREILEKEKISKYSNLAFSLLFLIISIAVTIYQFSSKTKNDQLKEEIVKSVGQKVEETIKEQESSKYPDYRSLGSLKHLSIISNFETWTPNSKLQDDKTKMSIVLDKGKLSKGYVYIRGSIDGNPLTRSESVYLKMNSTGGHIVKSRSLPVPASDKTELLFPLDIVMFYSRFPYVDNSPQFSVNFLKMFYPGGSVRIDSFISSLKPALIEDFSIYYDCELDQECSLTVTSQD